MAFQIQRLGALKRQGLNILAQRLNSTDNFKSTLGPPLVESPFQDPSKTRILPINHGNVFAQLKTTNLKPPQAMVSPIVEVMEQNVESEIVPPVKNKTTEISKTASEVFEKKDTSTQVIDETAVLRESLRKLEEAAEKVTAGSSSGGNGGNDGHEEEHGKEFREKMERNTRRGGIFVGGTTIIGAVAFCLYYGRAKRDEAGNVIEDEFTGSIFAPISRIFNSFKGWKDYVVEPARDVLLPDPLPAPYLQPKYTIVIEMKNILVHPEWTYKTGYRFLKRPALDYFLDVIGYPNFEVVIYTSESMMTAAPVVESFDPKQRIMYKLFRDCTKYKEGHHIKDLAKLNRDLSKVIFIDFDPKSGQLNPENLLRIPEWKGNMDDTSLVDLAELLKTIHLSDTDDVRPMIQMYAQYDDPSKEFRRRAIYLSEQESQKPKADENASVVSRYTGKLFGFKRHSTL